MLRRQAELLGLPLYEISIPYPCSNADYEVAMNEFLERVRNLPPNLTASHMAFGDLFLEDIREYREDRLKDTGFTPIFPIWGRPTRQLAETMIWSGLRAIVTALNPEMLDPSFAGRWFDRSFLRDLPEEVDPLGENGEFHTCLIAGPMLSEPINAIPGRVVTRSILASPDADDEDDTIHQRSSTPSYFYADIELLD